MLTSLLGPCVVEETSKRSKKRQIKTKLCCVWMRNVCYLKMFYKNR